MLGPYLEQTRLLSFAEIAYCSVSFAGNDRNQNPELPWLVANSSILLSAEAEFPLILIRNPSWLGWDGFAGSIGNAPKKAELKCCWFRV